MKSYPGDVRVSIDIAGLEAGQLEGFFDGWPTKPSSGQLLTILRNSYRAVIAVTPSGRVVGIVTAISDGSLSAFIPLVEVLPEYRRRGIGSALVRRMLEELRDMYAVDLTCDPELAPFYEGLGLARTVGMSLRDPAAIEQST